MSARLTRMDWMRRANDAGLGGGADITPEPPTEPEPVKDDWLDEWWYQIEQQEIEQPESDPMSDEPFEKENNV